MHLFSVRYEHRSAGEVLIMESLKAGRTLDLLVAEKVMGQFACGEWTPHNFGSAGGPAFRKNCEHEN